MAGPAIPEVNVADFALRNTKQRGGKRGLLRLNPPSPPAVPAECVADVSEEFRLRSVAVAAYGPATLFGLAEGSMLPVITLSAIDRGASLSAAALVNALLGIASLLTNIPSGALATWIGERRSMLVAAVATVAGLACCLVNLGHARCRSRPSRSLLPHRRESRPSLSSRSHTGSDRRLA